MSQSMRFAAVCGCLLVLSAPVFGGEVSSLITDTHDGGLNDGTTKSRLIVDGGKFRVEYQPGDAAPDS